MRVFYPPKYSILKYLFPFCFNYCLYYFAHVYFCHFIFSATFNVLYPGSCCNLRNPIIYWSPYSFVLENKSQRKRLRHKLDSQLCRQYWRQGVRHNFLKWRSHQIEKSYQPESRTKWQMDLNKFPSLHKFMWCCPIGNNVSYWNMRKNQSVMDWLPDNLVRIYHKPLANQRIRSYQKVFGKNFQKIRGLLNR